MRYFAQFPIRKIGNTLAKKLTIVHQQLPKHNQILRNIDQAFVEFLFCQCLTTLFLYGVFYYRYLRILDSELYIDILTHSVFSRECTKVVYFIFDIFSYVDISIPSQSSYVKAWKSFRTQVKCGDDKVGHCMINLADEQGLSQFKESPGSWLL